MMVMTLKTLFFFSRKGYQVVVFFYGLWTV